jgi:DNA-binding MarR family transcriptional regulator
MRRDASDEDGRLVLVSLTPEGRELYRKVMPIARKWNQDLFACLDDREREALRRALDKVIEAAQTE